MINKSEHIKQLYRKHLDHSATNTDYYELFSYLKNPENLEILKQEMDREWKYNADMERFSPLLWEEIEIEIRKREAIERKQVMERRNLRIWGSAAASLLLILGLSIGIYWISGPEEYLIYRTGYGEVEKVMLDDGSQVTLNANSVLKWKSDWKGEGKRIAILDGEAYFDVETLRDPTGKKTGFDVQTNDMTIQVVGTAFNVKSRTEKTDVYLDEGKIHLDLKEELKNSRRSKEEVTIVMNPGESVSYSSHTKKLDRAESDQYGNASWMAGTFMYSNLSVKEILSSLEDIYGVTFQVNDQDLLHRKLTTNLPYSDWPIVQSSLELLLQARLERKDNIIAIKKEE